MWGTPIPAADHAKDYLTLRDLVTQEKTLGKMLIGPDVAYRLDYFTEYVAMLLYYEAEAITGIAILLCRFIQSLPEGVLSATTYHQ